MKNAGLCSVTFRRKTAEEVIELAVENGIDCIEWGGDVHVPPADLANAARVGELTRARGIKTLSYGSYFKCRTGEDFALVSACAKALGAQIIRVWSGEKSACSVTEEEYAALVRTVKGCARIARENGQAVAFEYHGNTYTDSPESTLKLLCDVNESNVHCYFQPAYWNKINDPAAKHRENLRALQLLKEHVVGVHVYEWRGIERLPLREGFQVWRDYVQGTAAAYYDLEFVKDDSERQFEEDAETLKELCSE